MTCCPPERLNAATGRVLTIAYVLGFGLSTMSALVVLVAPAADDSGASSAWGGYVLQLMLALAAAEYGRRAARRQFGLDEVDLGLTARHPLSARRFLGVSAIYVLVLAASAWVTVHGLGLLGATSTTAGAGTTTQLAPELFHAATAGLVEEIVLLALPLALARRCDWSTSRTMAVLVVMRLGIHLYLGWYALFVIPWLAAAMLLWRRCQSVWPFVLGHGAYDVIQLLGARDDGVVTLMGPAGLVVLGTAALIVTRVPRSSRPRLSGPPGTVRPWPT